MAQNHYIDGFAFARGKYLPEIVGLRYTMSGSLEVESPRREQRGIEADIEDVCHSTQHK